MLILRKNGRKMGKTHHAEKSTHLGTVQRSTSGSLAQRALHKKKYLVLIDSKSKQKLHKAKMLRVSRGGVSLTSDCDPV